MSARKYKEIPLSEDKSQQKKIVESLIKRLNDKIINDPASAKKAALILEEWIKKIHKK